MCVHEKDMLVIAANTIDGRDERAIEFSPKLNGYNEDEITIGASKMHVKVT